MATGEVVFDNLCDPDGQTVRMSDSGLDSLDDPSPPSLLRTFDTLAELQQTTHQGAVWLLDILSGLKG